MTGCATTREMRSDVKDIFFKQLSAKCYTTQEKINYWKGKKLMSKSPYRSFYAGDHADKRALIPLIFLSGYYDYTTPIPLSKQLLDKLVEKHPPLKASCDEIYAQGRTLTTLINGIEAISGDGTFLKALSDGTIYDMICDMNKTKEKFIEILKQSQMEAQIDWLNSLTSFEIDETNFKSDYLLELLKNGLITLSFKKEF